MIAIAVEIIENRSFAWPSKMATAMASDKARKIVAVGVDLTTTDLSTATAWAAIAQNTATVNSTVEPIVKAIIAATATASVEITGDGADKFHLSVKMKRTG